MKLFMISFSGLVIVSKSYAYLFEIKDSDGVLPLTNSDGLFRILIPERFIPLEGSISLDEMDIGKIYTMEVFCKLIYSSAVNADQLCSCLNGIPFNSKIYYKNLKKVE